MSQPASDLADLLGQLRKARDPWSRLRLVATGARALARLTPAQRKDLLRTIGLDGAEELAEIAAGGDPRVSTALEGALRELESNPQQVQQILREVADPHTRRATLNGLAAHLLESLTAPTTKPGDGPASAKGTPTATAKDTGSTTAAAAKAGAVAAVATASAARTAAAAPPPPLTRSERREKARQAAAPPAASSRPTAPAAASPRPPAAVPAPPVMTAPPAAPARMEPATPAAHPPAPAAAPLAEPAASPAPLPAASVAPASPVSPPGPPAPLPAFTITPAAGGKAAGGALRTLGTLRAELAQGDLPSADGLAVLVTQELNADWARRRALAAAFACGVPAGLDEAIQLVAQIGSPAQRRWALGDLAASRAWTDPDWDRLLTAADSPTLRRRLASRRRP